MKILSIFMISLMGFTNAFAETVIYTKEKNPQELDTYIRAVNDVMRASKMKHIPTNMPPEKYQEFLKSSEQNIPCVFRTSDERRWNSWNFNRIVTFAESVQVTDGTQPLLQFKTREYNLTATLTITTSVDYKNILKATVTSFSKKNINVGDLKSPRYEDVWYENTDMVCTIENKIK